MSTSMLREFANQWLTERYGMEFALPDAGNGLSSLMQSSPTKRGNTPLPNPALSSTSLALAGNPEDDDDPAEAANSIADILYHLFGDEALSHLDEVLPMSQYAREWDESKIVRHPKGKREGGRFAKKHDASSLQDMHNNIASSLKGQRTGDSVKQLASHLGNLTISQLHDLKKQYGISASGRTKQDLVSKIADRLDRGRRTPDEQTPPEEQQQREQPPEDSAMPEMPPAGTQAPAGPPVPAPLQKATQRRKAILEKHLGPQEDPFQLKAEPAPRPAPTVKLTNPNTQQQSLFDAGQGDLPGQQTLFDDIGTQGQPSLKPEHQQMQDIIRGITGGEQSTRVRLADVLAKSGMPKEQMQKTLWDMERQGLLSLYRVDDPDQLRPEDHAAAITTPGGTVQHILYEGGNNSSSGRKPVSPPAVKPEPMSYDDGGISLSGDDAVNGGDEGLSLVGDDPDYVKPPEPQGFLSDEDVFGPGGSPPSAPAPQVPQAAAADMSPKSTGSGNVSTKPESSDTSSEPNRSADKIAKLRKTASGDPNSAMTKAAKNTLKNTFGIDVDKEASQPAPAPAAKPAPAGMTPGADPALNGPEAKRMDDMIRKNESFFNSFERKYPGVEADILAQDVRMALFEAAPTFQGGEDQMRAIATKIAGNKYTDMLRHKHADKRDESRTSSLDAPMGDDGETMAGSLLDRASVGGRDERMFDKLHQVVSSLPAEHGNLLKSLFFDEQSGEDVGKSLGVSRQTVMQRKKNALAKLRETLDAEQYRRKNPRLFAVVESEVDRYFREHTLIDPQVERYFLFGGKSGITGMLMRGFLTALAFSLVNGMQGGGSSAAEEKPEPSTKQPAPQADSPFSDISPFDELDQEPDSQPMVDDSEPVAPSPRNYPDNLNKPADQQTPYSPPERQEESFQPPQPADNPPQAPKGTSSWPSWDDPSHPRHKKGDAQGKGGQFAPKDQNTSSPPEAPESPETPSAATDDTNDVRQPKRASESTPEAQEQTPATPMPQMPKNAKQAINDVAMEYELDPEELFHFANAEIESQRDYHTQRESKKADARKATGMNAGNLAKLENSGKDASSGNAARRGFDTAATELGMEGDEDVWGLIREGEQDLPKINDPAFLRRMAADLAHMKQNGDMNEPDPMEHFREPTTNKLGEFVPFSRPRVGIERM